METPNNRLRVQKSQDFGTESGDTPEEDTMTNDTWAEVRDILKKLYGLVDRLEKLFPDRKFTPDGHQVGSIGEVVAAWMFDLSLCPPSTEVHDAVTADGRTRVQIKMTQTDRVGLGAEPDHLLVLSLKRGTQSVKVVYNGRGKAPWSKVKDKVQKNGQAYISLSRLCDLDKEVPASERLLQLNDL